MKWNNIKRYNALVLAAALCLAAPSCHKGYLDLEPYGSLPADQSLETADDMETAVNGIYATLRSANLYGRTIPLVGDLLADNVYISTTNSNRYLEFQQVNYTVANGNANGIWQSAYQGILNANNVINCSLQGTAQIDQLRGEALALRGLLYFELSKFFCTPYLSNPSAMGVPLVLTYDPFLKPQRNSLADVYSQIEQDFKASLPLLTQYKSSGYLSYYAVEGLLSRFYLFKGDWSQALSYAQDVIDNSGFQLVTRNQYENYWKSNTPNSTGLETLFEVVFDLVGNAGNSSLPYFYDQAGYGDALCARAFYDSYSATDIRKNLILVGSPSRGNVRVVNKYPNSTQPDKDEFKVIRLSEVYLNAAEASYHLNDEPGALDYVNAIAMQRDDAFAGYSSSGQALLDDILEERRKELAFEGHRYWDLARNNLDVQRINSAGNYPANVPLVIPVDYFRRILPIPQTELDANPNIRDEQNPGY